jgi:hypothetical protein
MYIVDKTSLVDVIHEPNLNGAWDGQMVHVKMSPLLKHDVKALIYYKYFLIQHLPY